jgi:hypothetical protein
MQTQEWKIKLPPVERDDEIERLETLLDLAARRLKAADEQNVRAIEVAKDLSERLKSRTLECYDKGFASGFAAGVAAEAGQREPQRRTVERDEAGRIVAIVG